MNRDHEIEVTTESDAAPQSVAVMILGMHRSGTSAVARLMNILGAQLPARLLTGLNGVDTKHWEPAEIVKINDEILNRGGSEWRDWRRFDLKSLSDDVIAEYRRRIVISIAEDYGNSEFIVLKDPRICRLMELYDDLLNQNGREVRYLLPFRNPLSVIASLQKRDQMTRPYSALLWLRHVVDAEVATRNKRRWFVSYEGLLEDWRPEVEAIIGRLGPLNAIDTPLSAEIGAYLTRDSQHHIHSSDETTKSEELVPWVKHAYAALQRLSKNTEDTEAMATLDGIRGEFDTASAVFGDAVFPEMTVRVRKAAQSLDYWRTVATKQAGPQLSAEDQGQNEVTCNDKPANRPNSSENAFAAIEGSMQSVQEGTRKPPSQNQGGLGRTEEVERLSTALRISEEALRAREDEINELRQRDSDLSSDLTVARQELGRILQSRSYRLAQRLQVAYTRWGLVRRVANLQLTSNLFKLTPSTLPHKPRTSVPADLRRMILASGLFDEAYYRNRYSSKIIQADDILADYMSSEVAELRDPGPLFSARFYINTHPDVALSGMNPLEHFLRFGSREGRIAFSPERVRDFLTRADAASVVSIFDVIPKGSRVTVLYAETGNFFFRDIAVYVAELLREQGCPAQALPDLPEGINPETEIVLVVAPHEFFFVGPGKSWDEERRNQVVHLNTEQWQTPWFAKCFSLIASSKRGTLDMNPNSAAGLAQLGLKSAFLPIVPFSGSVFEQKRQPINEAFSRLKYIPELDYADEIGCRVYDIAYVAVSNPRRNKALAEMAGTLSSFRCFIHTPRFSRPITRDDPNMLSGSDLTQIARNSKIILNIHRDHVGYLEWHRIFLYGVVNGCVVVTEPCFRNDYIEEGKNFLAAPLEKIPELLNQLLRTEDGGQKLKEISERNLELMRSIDAGNRLLY